MSFPDPTMDENMSDFDNSDEDIASLLADDEDDVLGKIPFGSSPNKNHTKSFSDVLPKKPTSLSKSVIPKKELSEKMSSKSSPIRHGISKTVSNEISDTEDDALDDLLSDSSMPSFLRDTKKSPGKKSGIKLHESLGDESRYLDELGFTQLSSDSVLKNRRRSSIKSNLGEGDQSEDDILKSLESDEKEPGSQKRKSSYFDDFLKTLSPKQSPKKSTPLSSSQSQEQIERSEDPFEEDILGKFSSKSKTNKQAPKHSTPENKRDTLIKQVSFKDLPETLSSNESPNKERNSSAKNESETELKAQTKPTSKLRRSEKLGDSKNDDTDWLSFFKESPKKTKNSIETGNKLKSLEEKHIISNDFKANNNRRRSSSADWLGLSESNALPDKIDEKDLTLSREIDLGSEKPPPLSRPRTTGSSIVSRPRRKIAEDLSWLGEESKPSPNDQKKDLSEVLYHPTNTMDVSNENMFIANKDIELNANKKTVLSKEASFEEHISPSKNILLKPTVEASTRNNSESHLFRKEESSNKTKFTKMGKNTNDIKETSVSLEEKSQLGCNNDHALPAIINNHTVERELLLKSSEAMKKVYEERIRTMENLHKDQLKSLEECLTSLNAKLKKEMEDQIQTYEEKIHSFKKEKMLIEMDKKEKLDLATKQNLDEIQRLKNLHNQSIESLKRDHEDALSRLQRLKEQEIDVILSTQSHTRSLQHLADQLESGASELASLQIKVEERNENTLREKKLQLESKERDLKNMQIRLQRQLDDGDEERNRLQQLVLRLESRLQKNTTDSEEEKWEVQQLKTRLLIQQKHLEEEYKLQMQQVEREKEKLYLSKDSILHEQKTVLQQLAQERQQLMQEKVNIDLLSKKIKEEETKFHVKKLKEESFIERQKIFIQEEESRLQYEKSHLKQEADQLERERESLLMEKQLFKEEKMKFNDLTYQIRRKETEAEALAMSVTEERERVRAEHATVVKIKSEHQNRMQQITQKMQALMEKEHQILEEKENLAEEKLLLDNKKNDILCNKCKLSLGFPVNAPPSGINTAAVRSITTPTNHIGIPFINSSGSSLNAVTNHVLPAHIDPSLVVWYITAKNDRDYLQGELSFLKSLKESKK